MKLLKIDPEYRALLPNQTDEERAGLVESILADGCRDALIVDQNDTIIDGHNRYEVCTEHGVPFQTITKHFDSREETIVFICKNQMGRRNLTQEQWQYALGKRYEAEKKMHGGHGGNRFTVQTAQNDQSVKTRDTSDAIANDIGTSRATVVRSGRFANGVDSIASVDMEAKQKILSGKSGLPMYAVEKVAKLPEQELAKAVEHIKRGEGRKVADELKEKEREHKACRGCGKTFDGIDIIHARNGWCRECNSKRAALNKTIDRTRDIEAQRKIAEDAQRINDEMRDLSRVYVPQVEHAVDSLQMTAKSFAHQLDAVIEEYGGVLREAPEKIKAALLEAKAAVERIEVYVHE